MRTLLGIVGLSLVVAWPVAAKEPLGWKPHSIKQGDDKGGWVERPSQFRFLHKKGGKYTFPFGVLQMANGEIILAASWNDGSNANARLAEKPVVAWSKDRGNTWTEFTIVPKAIGRPVMLTELGKGRLVFQTDPLGPFLSTQHFSKDYGRTWPEFKELQKAANGGTTVGGTGVEGFFGAEGNPLVDRDKNGKATRIAQVGWNFAKGSKWPGAATAGGILRWSRDGARTWTDETVPKAWRFSVQHQGKKFTRGVSEGALVRAANGWLVAALRTDMPPRYLGAPNDDSLEGTGVSVSKDDGKTWSPIQVLFDAGRHHAHLLKLPNGDLVMTLIVRVDIRDGKLASYRRGIEALVSHDHGLTWNLDRRYILDEFEFYDGQKWYNGETGHLSSTLLDNGSILTVYGKYMTQGVNLIRWRPAATKDRSQPRGKLGEARKKAAHRQRRIIYNNDGDDIWAKGADTVDKFLALRHKPLLGTQVDSIFYCTTQSFNLFTHDTRVAEVFQSREGTFAHNNLKTFIEKNTDPLRMSCAFARKHQLEVVWTLRMNDIHDAWTPQFVSQWKKTDPRRVMSTPAATKSFNDRRRLWSLVDFEHSDVEPRLVAIIKEVLRNYPVDGIELDFLRAPFYFRTAYEGRPATAKQIAILTRLVRNIRQMVLRESERQGKPFLLTARVPVTTALCRRIGIDIKSWLKDRFLDVLALGGGYVAFDQPVAGLIELGHKHGVPVYPCLSQSGLLVRPPRGMSEPQPAAAWNGAALRMLEAGADGIYAFNLFPGPGPKSQHDEAVIILKTIGTKETLLKADRLFAVSDAGWSMPAHYWAKDAEEFSSSCPVALSAKSATTTPLYVAGPISIEGSKVQTELRLDFTGLAESEPPTVMFNSKPLGKPARSVVVAGVRRFHYPVATSAVKTGRNQVRVEALSNMGKLAGAELWLTRLR